MQWMRGSAALALLLIPALSTGGCASVTWHEATVHVQDLETGDPVGDAVVGVEPLTFFVPTQEPLMGFKPGFTLTPDPPVGANASSATPGVVQVRVPAGTPSQIIVWAPGFALVRYSLVGAGTDTARLSPLGYDEDNAGELRRFQVELLEVASH